MTGLSVAEAFSAFVRDAYDPAGTVVHPQTLPLEQAVGSFTGDPADYTSLDQYAQAAFLRGVQYGQGALASEGDGSEGESPPEPEAASPPPA